VAQVTAQEGKERSAVDSYHEDPRSKDPHFGNDAYDKEPGVEVMRTARGPARMMTGRSVLERPQPPSLERQGGVMLRR